MQSRNSSSNVSHTLSKSCAIFCNRMFRFFPVPPHVGRLYSQTTYFIEFRRQNISKGSNLSNSPTGSNPGNFRDLYVCAHREGSVCGCAFHPYTHSVECTINAVVRYLAHRNSNRNSSTVFVSVCGDTRCCH